MHEHNTHTTQRQKQNVERTHMHTAHKEKQNTHTTERGHCRENTYTYQTERVERTNTTQVYMCVCVLICVESSYRYWLAWLLTTQNYSTVFGLVCTSLKWAPGKVMGSEVGSFKDDYYPLGAN